MSKTNQDATFLLSGRMRAEWDRRIRHDYRYWMSDGIENDQAMWETGRRDLEILLGGPEPIDHLSRPLKECVSLEIGCGVGRLLRAASERFGRALGIDVSEEAVSKSRRLLSDRDNVQVYLGNGLDLAQIEDGSIDFAYTFAALSSMPVLVIARYLNELSRVLKAGGVARLQVYLGKPQDTVTEDSIAIRSFSEECFRSAIEAAGFSLLSLYEFKLPFEISDSEAGLNARIVGLVRERASTASAEEINALLLPEGESSASAEWPGSRVEYWMALTRARNHLEAGDLVAAAAALEFAVEHYNQPEAEVKELLAEIRRDLATAKNATALSLTSREAACSSENLKIVESRFPVVGKQLQQLNGAEAELVQAEDGNPVVMFLGQALDQLGKPGRAGEVWAERAQKGERFSTAEIIIVAGFGTGYHLESLRVSQTQKLVVYEPNPAVLKAALEARDLSGILNRLAGLFLSTADLKSWLAESQANNSSVHLLTHPQTQIIARDQLEEVKQLLSRNQGLASIRPSIAVVGPIYGGSLPIANYVYRALKQLGQRVHYYDLSKFVTAYRSLDEMVKSPERINALQGHYVEMLSQIVLEGVTERPVDMVICLAQAPLSPRVLTELRRKGIITVMWFVEDCRRFQTWRDIARFYDYMFIIQQGEFLKQIEAAGAGKCHYLPVGCDPEIHAPTVVAPDELERWGSEISFVGAGYNNRQQMFAHLARRDFKIWGTEWPFNAPFDKLVQEKGRRIDPTEYIKIFNTSKINLNLHSSMERDGVEPFGDFINPRTFELAACGAFQLTDNRVNLGELFELGSEMATFSDQKEMEQQIDFYLAHPEERRKITDRARARALKDHTYAKRMEEMLGLIYADRLTELKGKLKSSPWEKTLSRAEKHPELKHKFRTVYERGDDPKLEELVADIQIGKGALSRTEHQLSFLHHIKTQISFVQKLRNSGQ